MNADNADNGDNGDNGDNADSADNADNGFDWLGGFSSFATDDNPVLPGFPNGLKGVDGDNGKSMQDIQTEKTMAEAEAQAKAAQGFDDTDLLSFHHKTETFGKPTGPLLYVEEFGTEVRTFDRTPTDGKPCLMYHVPFNKRGPFRPEQLSNFDENREYRTDEYGYVLCYGRKVNGELCPAKAQNRFPRCHNHGGRLHPWDRAVQKGLGGKDPSMMSRYQMFLSKMIGVDDLDDEEILNFGFRKNNGKLFKPRHIPREMVNEITRAIYDRALNEIKGNAITAAKTLATIMIDPTNDASIRLKAAEAILDRSIGKAPQTLNINAAAPWEEIFESISTVTRSESRAVRGDVLDVDVIGQSDANALTASPTPP